MTKTRLTLFLSVLAAATAVALPFMLVAGGAPARHQALTAFKTPVPVARPAVPVPIVVPARPPVYTVVAGDTLSAVGSRLGLSWEQIAGWNRLTWAEAQSILPGQVLRLPPDGYRPPPLAPPVTARPPAARSYVSGMSVPAGSGFEACVIARESGGNPQVMNGSGHYGLYQFSYSTWVANGGPPGDFGRASPAEQHAVFARSAPSNWTPYDGC